MNIRIHDLDLLLKMLLDLRSLHLEGWGQKSILDRKRICREMNPLDHLKPSQLCGLTGPTQFLQDQGIDFRVLAESRDGGNVGDGGGLETELDLEEREEGLGLGDHDGDKGVFE